MVAEGKISYGLTLENGKKLGTVNLKEF